MTQPLHQLLRSGNRIPGRISLEGLEDGYLQKTAGGSTRLRYLPNETAEQYGRRRLETREGVYPPRWDPKKKGSVYVDSRGYDTLPFGLRYTPEVAAQLRRMGVPDPRRNAVDLDVIRPLAKEHYDRMLRQVDKHYVPESGERDEHLRHALASKLYQLGPGSPSAWPNFWKAVNRGDMQEAVREIYRGKQDPDTGEYAPSKWSQQTPVRANDLRDSIIDYRVRQQQAPAAVKAPAAAPEQPPATSPEQPPPPPPPKKAPLGPTS